MKPLISVIMPVFNGERYLAAALQSVVSQTYRPLEIVVVDDGSTDGSARVVARFARAVRYVYQENHGTGAARNRGLDLAEADYLAFLDQDDVWCADKLTYQMDALQANPALDMVFGHVRQFYSPDWTEARRVALYCPPMPVPGHLPSALLVKRSSFLRAGPFATCWRIGEWADWYTRAADAGLTSLVLPRLVAWRRLHGHNHGLTARASAPEYARILKASLDRRRRRSSSAL